MSKGRLEDARKVLAKYHAGGDGSSALVQYEMQEIMDYLSHEATVKSETSYKDMLHTPANRHRTLLAVLLGFFSQWSGIGVVGLQVLGEFGSGSLLTQLIGHILPDFGP